MSCVQCKKDIVVSEDTSHCAECCKYIHDECMESNKCLQCDEIEYMCSKCTYRCENCEKIICSPCLQEYDMFCKDCHAKFYFCKFKTPTDQNVGGRFVCEYKTNNPDELQVHRQSNHSF